MLRDRGMIDDELSRMSLKELEAFQHRIHEAIKAAIRAKRLAGQQPPRQPAVAPVDLERERDAWLAQRQVGGGAKPREK